MTTALNIFKFIISGFIFIGVLVSCSKSLDEMSLYERAIHHPHRFSSDASSDKYRKPLDVLNFVGIKPGMKIVDLLGGAGYYSEIFNYIVGENGKVYLQNNSLFLSFSEKELTDRLNNDRLKNVIRLDSEFSNMKLPKNMDMIFIGLSYHDIYVPRKDPVITANRAEFFKQIKSSLKQGGILLIIDHAAKPGSGISMTPKLHRIDEEWTIKDIEKEGFDLVAKSNILRNESDDYDLDIWNKKVFHKTDRFVHKYQMR